MEPQAPTPSLLARIGSAPRIERPAAETRDLLEFRSVGVVPPWLQFAAVPGLFVATVLLAHAEYRAKGTTFGTAGPAFNALVCPIYNVFWLEPAALARSMAFTGLVLGPLLGWVALRCRSVWPAVILHYLNNLAYFARH